MWKKPGYAEGGDICVTFASGMAGISAGPGLGVEAGQQGGFRIEAFTAARIADDELSAALWAGNALCRFSQPRFQCGNDNSGDAGLYFETPINPTLELIDIEAIPPRGGPGNAGREKTIASW